MKKLFSFFLALVTSAGITQAAIVDGTCGPNLTWSLNTKDSTLTITGSGEITSTPWEEYKSYIKYASLPEGLTNIAGFYDCHNLLSIKIPNSVTSIGGSAFMWCTNLISVILDDNVTSIGDNAFRACNVQSLTISNSVTNIGNCAFLHCPISKINFIGGIDEWCNKTWKPNDISESYQLLLNGELQEHLTIPNSIVGIENNAFYGCVSLISIEIPNSVTNIGEQAFYGCTNLIEVKLPTNITHIENNIFKGCSKLSTIEIPNSVTIISSGAFESCNSLTSIEIPNSVTTIGGSYIDHSKPGEHEPYMEYNGAFSNCSNLTNLILGDGIVDIGESAFSGSNIIRLTVSTPTPPNGGMNSGINNISCKLFVPQSSIDTYANAIWWEDFASIRAIGSGFIVKFLDWNGTILSSQEIDSGEDAITPPNPVREGYTFIGWDKEFSHITEDLVVTAQYKTNRYEVIFKDWDETVLKSDSVNWNTAATAPANPSREGYTFYGWDKAFSQVTENMTITAQYELGENKTVTVIYANGNDESEILSQQLSMKVPSAPEIAGFTFLGWFTVASVFAEPENTITIQAVYQANTPTSAPAVYTNPANPAQKLIRNGNVYILTEDKTYSIEGRRVK